MGIEETWDPTNASPEGLEGYVLPMISRVEIAVALKFRESGSGVWGLFQFIACVDNVAVFGENRVEEAHYLGLVHCLLVPTGFRTARNVSAFWLGTSGV